MLEDVYVVDNFYDNPDFIRDLALNAEYLEYRNSNVPGYESEKSYYTDKHLDIFKNLINKDILIDPNKYTYGKFRYSLKNSPSLSEMHIDSLHWSAIVYLSKNEHSKGGLGIYKHKPSNLSYVPQTVEELNQLGFQDRRHLDKVIVRPDTKNKSAWEVMEFIPVKYNRMVLFPGSKYFHTVTNKFGSNINDARLSHNFFFNQISSVSVK